MGVFLRDALSREVVAHPPKLGGGKVGGVSTQVCSLTHTDVRHPLLNRACKVKQRDADMGLSIQTMTQNTNWEKLGEMLMAHFQKKNLSSILLFLSAPAGTSFGSAWPQTEK